jgi:hypothetical protein
MSGKHTKRLCEKLGELRSISVLSVAKVVGNGYISLLVGRLFRNERYQRGC